MRKKSILRINLLVCGVALIVLTVGLSASGSQYDLLPATTLRVDLAENSVVVSDDIRGLGKRLTFSTVGERERAPQLIELRNGSSGPVRITNASIDNEAFVVSRDTQSFELAPGTSKPIKVTFEPKTTGVSAGKLVVTVEGAPSFDVSLGGLNARNFEGNNEPNLQDILDALGYKASVGMPQSPPADIGVSKSDAANSISKSDKAIGDEVLAQTFQRADATAPVRMVPLANYILRSNNQLGWFGINQHGSRTETQQALAFPGGKDGFGGQNQQLLPGLGDGTYSGLIVGSKLEFVPKFERFGIWDGFRSNFSEDALNDASDHAMRIYPAVRADGTPIANAYLVADDSGVPGYKNFDYQDVVFLISNVKPAPDSSDRP